MYNIKMKGKMTMKQIWKIFLVAVALVNIYNNELALMRNSKSIMNGVNISCDCGQGVIEPGDSRSCSLASSGRPIDNAV